MNPTPQQTPERLTQLALNAVTKFTTVGPYTFDELLAVARRCAKTDTVRLNIDSVLFKFDDTELAKYVRSFHDTKVCTHRNFKKLSTALELGQVFYMDLSQFTKSQLAVIEENLSYAQFEYLLESIQLHSLTLAERLALLDTVQVSQVRNKMGSS